MTVTPASRRAYRAALALVLLGWACVLLRVTFMIRADRHAPHRGWRLEYRAVTSAHQAGGRLAICLPEETRALTVTREWLEHPDYLVSNRRLRHGGRALSALPFYKDRPAFFSAAFSVFPQGRPQERIRQDLSTSQRESYLQEEPGIPANAELTKKILASVRAKNDTPRELVGRLFRFCSRVIVHSLDPENQGGLDALHAKRADALGQSRALVALCRTAKTPARVVTGFVLRRETDARPHHWVEAHLDDGWVAFDPAYGFGPGVPQSYLPVSREETRVVAAVGALSVEQRFSIHLLSQPAPAQILPLGSAWDVLNLTRLPLGMRHSLGLLLLLPFGALITACFRNLVGLQTFGTFTPALLALSLILADWRVGLAILVVILLFAIANRFLIESLQLLLVPRLGVTLTGIVLCLAVCVSLLYAMDLATASQVLLPVVILVMMTERFYVTEAEDSLRQALLLTVGTLAVTAVCYLALWSSLLRETMIRFPEGLLFILALLVVLGRYAGYRLAELVRFRDALREDESP